jgi:predicted porin
MKKHLIAAAVAAAVAVPAAAQVTVSGVLDTGYSNRAQDINTGATEVKTSGIGLASGIATSRIRFAGVEDLGGGLKAGVALEQQLNFAQAADLLGNGTNNRESSLMISGGFGTIKFGRFVNVGKVMKDSFTSFGGGASFAQGSATIYALGGGSNSSGAEGSVDTINSLTANSGLGLATDRNNNLVNYTSPKFNGFEVQAEARLNSKDNTNAAGTGKQETSGQALRISYGAGPLAVAVARTNYKAETEAVPALNICISGAGVISTNAGDCSTSSGGMDSILNTGAVSATTNKFEVTQLGATYSLAGARLFASWVDAEIKPLTANSTDIKAYDLGLTYALGSTTLVGSIGKGDSQSGTTKVEVSSYLVQARHALSKRTTAYAMYGQNENKTATAKSEDAVYMIGVAHSF